MDYEVSKLSRKEFLTFFLFWISGCMVLGDLFYQSLIAGLVLTLFVHPAAREYSRILAERRRRQLSYQFRDLLSSLSASLSAGHPMREALLEAEENMALIYEAEAPIRQEAAYMVKRMGEAGETEESVLQDLGQRSGLSDIQDFAQVYSICRQTGGNLERAVQKASDVLMDKIQLQREVDTLTAQKKLEAGMLVALPLLLLFLLRLLSPEYLAVMYGCVQGRLMMTGALLGIGLAALLTYRLTRVQL